MTESQWLACNDPLPMFDFLWHKASGRRLRLFAVSCCRRIWHLLNDPRSRLAVEVSERYADGLASDEDLEEAGVAADAAADDTHGDAAEAADSAADVLNDFRSAVIAAAVADDSLREVEKSAQCNLLRDIFGNPFRPTTINPAWLTPNVVALAQTIYDERVFDRLPELADALVSAGCDNQNILDHCRSEGPHVRGCWVVDLVLGKE